MYDSDNFISDMELLKGNPSTISAVDLSPPEDNYYLQYRHKFALLLYFFKSNNHEKLQTLANQYLPTIVKFIQDFDYNDIITFQDINSPPFDFFILTFMCSNSKPNYQLYILLYSHYEKIFKIIGSLKKMNCNIMLCDMTLRENFQVSLKEARQITKKRMNFIIEILISYLYNNRMKDMMITFMEDFCVPDKIKDERTLSFLYRISIAISEFELAEKYMNLIENQNLRLANEGYKNFLEQKFSDAINCFQNAGDTATESYINPCKKYLCELHEEPITTKTLTNEDKTQWPLQPKH